MKTRLGLGGMALGTGLAGLTSVAGCSGDAETATSGSTTTESAGGGGATATSVSTSSDGAGGSETGGGGAAGATTSSSSSSWTISVGPDAELTLLGEIPSPFDLQLTSTGLFARTSELAGKGIARVDLESGDVTTVVAPGMEINAYSVSGETVLYGQIAGSCPACSPGSGGVFAAPEAGGAAALLAELPDWAPQRMVVGEQGLYVADFTGALFRLPVTGGTPEIVVAAGVGSEIAADATGVYFVGSADGAIHLLDETSLQVTDLPPFDDMVLRLRAEGGFAYGLSSYPTKLSRVKVGGPVEALLSIEDPASQMAVNGAHAFVMGFAAPGDVDYPFGALYTAAPGSGQTGILAGDLYQPGDVVANDTHVYFVTYDTAGPSAIWRVNAP